jgi:hypothetical protein
LGKKEGNKMTDKEEKLARDALKYGFIFMLVVSIPIWLPIVAFGAFLCFPLYLIYLLVDEFEQDKKEKENEEQ